MNPNQVSYNGEYFVDEGILFVRINDIIQTMIRMPLIVVGLIVVAVVMPIQNSFGITRNLDLIIYPDGSTHITSEFAVDPLQPDFETDLFGFAVDNFIAIGENGFLLESQINKNTVTIETFGASSVFIEYDIHDLVSKRGRIWSFVFDTSSDYSLLMPANTVIVGISNLPLNMEIFENQSKLLLPKGSAQIDYIFVTAPIDPVLLPQRPNLETSSGNLLIIIGSLIAIIVGVIIAIYLRKNKHMHTESVIAKSKFPVKVLDTQTIFRLRPNLRDDDKEIISFIFNSGGQAKESELRKKFLQPRTTMWRAVKRLERHGIIEIVKKDQHNLVILKNELDDE